MFGQTAYSAMEHRLPLPGGQASPGDWSAFLKQLAESHACFSHPLFSALDGGGLDSGQAARLLRNYDCHASVLRRLLLRAASIMPEAACTYVLENVRNEYGNGNPDNRHQLQLLDLAIKAGVSLDEFKRARIQEGVRSYIRQVVPLYYPIKHAWPSEFHRAAIAAGAITATELLAIEEFVHLQRAFSCHNLAHHIWFHHLEVEVEHSDESLFLALYFVERYQAGPAVAFGMLGVLNANLDLYRGLHDALK